MASGMPDESAVRPRSPRKGVYVGVLAVAIVATIVVASIGFGPLPPSKTTTTPSTNISIPPSTTSTSSPPSASLALCATLTPEEELSNAKASTGPAGGTATYDEQLWLGFEQNFTSSISYNVTLRAQNDSYGYGPVYLLNGRTDAGYWY